MAPPEREEDYDERISDYLTNLLEKSDDAVFQVAVVCAIDRYNRFESDMGIPVNPEYNRSRFVPVQDTDGIAAYLHDIVERNGLTDNLIVQYHIPSVAYDVSQSGASDVVAGFKVEVTKKEILSLAADEDVKLICPMRGKWVDARPNNFVVNE